MRVLVAVLALALALPAVAKPQPAVYFLADGEMGPAGDGMLRLEAPEATNASIRPILPAVEDDLTVFLGNETPQDRIRGPLFIGYWAGPSAVYDGNVTATFYTLKDGTRTALGSFSFNVTTDPNSVNATALIPPDPQDVEGSIAYLQAQAIMQLLKPPKFLFLGVVDQQIEPGTSFMVGLRFEARAGGLPVPVGMPTVQYDSILSPTFLYVPWYAPDPPKPTTTSKPPTSGPTTSRGGTTIGGTSSEPGEDSPGLLAPAVLAALVAVALLRRR